MTVYDLQLHIFPNRVRGPQASARSPGLSCWLPPPRGWLSSSQAVALGNFCAAITISSRSADPEVASQSAGWHHVAADPGVPLQSGSCHHGADQILPSQCCFL